MPLARYEIRNEYSLANPDLYRAAAKDDPEGLLEGVAMAGLVGIVRQLGDLAEFAAEVFHDLHEEVYATAARGHELLIRVQQLEAELPVIEKLMCADIDHVKFSYNPGVEWHAGLRNDQNHFTQGDLPRFIRNAYEDCRGPPRLFLLDKFDVAGAGACLKRYTDPSFFKMEWASSELLKAEKEQQDKRARRIKKKGLRRRNGEIKEAGLLSQIHTRIHYTPLEVENLASTSSIRSNLDSEVGFRASVASVVGNSGADDPVPASSSEPVPQHLGDSLKVNEDAVVQDIDLISYSVSSNSGKICSQEIEAEVVSGKPAESNDMDVVMQKDLMMDTTVGEDAVDDVASETDHYVDALTTMDSEVETDSESKVKVEAESEFDKQLREIEISAPSTNDSNSDELKASNETNFHTEEDSVVVHAVTENSELSTNSEPVIFAESLPKPEISSIEEDGSPSVHHSHVSLFQESTVSSSFNESNISLSPSIPIDISRSDVHFESETINAVSETTHNLKLNDHDNIVNDRLSESFQQLPDPAIPLTKDAHTGFLEHFDTLSLHNGVQLSDLSMAAATGSSPGRGILEELESELTESPEEVSLQSRAGSTIQPRSWANDSLDTDDDMDGMQISSGSPSVSSSTLSSPRPSMLATTVFHMHSKGKPESLLSSPESYGSSPKYPINMELHSHSPVSPLKTASESSSSSEAKIQKIPPAGNSIASSPTQSPRFSMAEPQHSPPLPPLPPLEWRTMRRFNSTLSPPLNQMASPSTQKGSSFSLVRPERVLQTSKTFAVTPANNWKGSPAFPADADIAQLGSSSFSQTSENDKGTPIPAPDIPDHDDRFFASTSNVQCDSTVYPTTMCDDRSVDSNPWKGTSEAGSILKSPPKDEKLLMLPSMNEHNFPVFPSARGDESALNSVPPEVASNSEMQKSSESLQRPDSTFKNSWPFMRAKLERKDSLVDAIATHDRSMLRKVPEKSHSLQPVASNDRSVLLEQIRTGSFSLRHTKIKKQEVPRPTTNINVAAILEKANAIRQAFAGSDDEDDDDDDWSNT